jgi:hypothetical protein
MTRLAGRRSGESDLFAAPHLGLLVSNGTKRRFATAQQTVYARARGRPLACPAPSCLTAMTSRSREQFAKQWGSFSCGDPD